MKTSRNKIMPRNCYVFWLKNNQNPFKNAFNFFSLKPCTLYRRTDSNNCLKKFVLVNYVLFYWSKYNAKKWQAAATYKHQKPIRRDPQISLKQ